MTHEEIKILTESLVEASKLGTVNSLGYIKTGLEGYKKIKIPILGNDGQCHGERIPYKEDKEIQTFIDFMLVYLDEAIKSLEKDKEMLKNE